jgi:hypothetical protein
MPRRIWFGDDYWDFSDDVTKEEVDAVGMDWMRFGSMDAVRQKRAIEGLVTNPEYLALPQIERHAAFNQFAKDGPYWQILKPEERRAVRELVVNKAPGANEATSYNYRMAPFVHGGENLFDKMTVFEEGHQNLLGSAVGTLADWGRELDVRSSDFLASVWAGVTAQINQSVENTDIEEKKERLTGGWVGSLGSLFPGLVEAGREDIDRTQARNERVTGELADKARRVLDDVAISRSVKQGPTKYESFEQAKEEGGLGGYLRHGSTVTVGQIPQVGTNIALSLIPAIGPALSTEAMMAAETGGALDQMMAEGLEIGLEQQEAAVIAGAINGMLERVPIGALFNRIPGFKKPFKDAIWKHTWEVAKQGGTEAITELAQNIVTDAAVDVAQREAGNLDKIRWTTPEGRAESLGEAWEAAQAGNFTGIVMGLFGLGGAQLKNRIEQRGTTGEQVAAAAGPGPEVIAARQIIQSLGGDAGPRVPGMGGMEPTVPGQGPPDDAAPPGSAPPGRDTLPLPVGPGGASLGPRGEWSELDEQKARFNYRPRWLDANPELVEAFTRGDIDKDTLAEMEALAMAQGLDPMEARASILKARDDAWAFLRGDTVQGEQAPLAKIPTDEDFPDFPPSQADAGGQRTLGDAVGPGPAAPGPAPIPAEPVAPTQPHGVEGGPRRLGEGEGEIGPPPGPVEPPDLLTERVDDVPVQRPLQAPQPQPEPPTPPDRRERTRGRAIDAAAGVLFEIQRREGMNAELIGEIVDRITRGDDPHSVLTESKFRGLGDEVYMAATELGDQVFARYLRSEADRREAVEAGEATVEPEGPPPELTEEEIAELNKGPGNQEILADVERQLETETDPETITILERRRDALRKMVADQESAEGKISTEGIKTGKAIIKLLDKAETLEEVDEIEGIAKELGLGDQAQVKKAIQGLRSSIPMIERMEEQKKKEAEEAKAAVAKIDEEAKERDAIIAKAKAEREAEEAIELVEPAEERAPAAIQKEIDAAEAELKEAQKRGGDPVTEMLPISERITELEDELEAAKSKAAKAAREYPDLDKLPPAVGNFKSAIARAAGDQKELDRLDGSINNWIKLRMRKGEKLSPSMKQAVKALKADLEDARQAEPVDSTRAADVPIDETKKANFDKRAKSRGDTETVVTPDSGMQEDVEFVLVEAEHLTTSHEGSPLKENPEYPGKLQPRDRTRAASEEQVEDIKRKLDPARLGSGRVSNSGSPIVGADGVVESGNARTLAIKRAYDEKTEEAAAYKRWLVENAEAFGLNKNVLMGMVQPVLVRVRKSGERRAEFAERSAAPEAQTMSAAEVARKDAGNITTEMMGAFNPSESGDVTAASNSEFLRLFLDTLSKNERSDMMDAEGEISVDGVKRIENAVLAKAYGDAGNVVETLLESKDAQIKRIGAAMLKSAPAVMDARDSMAQGIVDPALDLVEPLMEAVTMINRLRREGMAIEKYLAQENLFGADMTIDGRKLLEHLSSKGLRNSAKAISEFIDRYYNNASRETFNDKNPPLMDLGVEAATRIQLIEMAIRGDDASGLFAQLAKGQDSRIKSQVLADIKSALPGWDILRHPRIRGIYRATRKGQPELFISTIDPLLITKKLAERLATAYGKPVEEVIAGFRAGTISIKGSYRMNDITGVHLINLYRGGDQGTLFEEAFHFAFHNVLTSPQRKLLIKLFESEENAADAYKEWASKRKAEGLADKGPVRKIFEVIKHFAGQLLKAQRVDVREGAKLIESIASGEIFNQPGSVYSDTDPLGAVVLSTTVNATLSAEQAAKKAAEVSMVEANISEVMEDQEEIRGPGGVHRGDHTMFQMETSPDIPDRHHPGVVLPEMTKTEQRRERAKTIIYDKLAPILRVQEKLTGVGEMIDNAINAYMKAANFQSRAGALLDWAQANLFEPLLNDIAASGIPLHDFDLFRMAIHALERNLKLRQMHVTVPLQVAEKKIRDLAKKKITTGAKVRDLKFGNKGKVKSVLEDRGKAEVEFVNPKNPFAKKRVLVDLAQIELESLARERDTIAEIRRMVEADETPHSGMPDAHAKAVLNEMRSLGLVDWSGELGPTTDYRGNLANLSKRFQDIVRWKENVLYRAGLLSKEELAKWRDYKYYTPMRGKDPDILDVIAGGRREALSQIEDYGGSMWNRAIHAMARAAGIEETIYTPAAGRGFNPGRRPAAHRALGRRSFPKHSPTAELITDAMQAAVRGERNRVAKTIWNLVNEIKNVKDVNGEKLFEIDTPDSRLVFDEKTGTVRTKVDGLSVTKNNVYSIWIDGKLHYIRAVSPQMAEFISALNNIGQHKDIHPVLKGAGAINRYISRMATSLNPGFVFPNAERDAITAGIKLAGEGKFKDFGLRTMERAPEAWQLLSTYSRHESAGTLDQMDEASRKRVERFKLAGGETAFWMIPDIELQMKRLQKALKRAKGDQNAIVTGFRSVTDFLEDYNGAVEGMMRFAVFERALEMGMTEDQAGMLARDITVDFTKQGTIAQTLGGLWVFANASIQGSMNMIKAVVNNKPLQRIVVGAFVFSFMHATMQRALGGKDEEDDIYYWDKIPWYEKSRNLIVMNPFEKGDYFKFPMPWGYNLFTAAGTASADVVNGRTTVKEAGANVLSTFLSAFNPIGDNDLTTLSGFFQMIMPSPLDPIFDIALNRTFWGGPIKPEQTKYRKSEQYGERQPEYNRYFNSVSKASKWTTRQLYKHTGIDISPEDVDYGIAAAFGGLGDTINRGVSTITKGLAGEPVSPREMPIIKSFYGQESEFFAPQMYRENMADYWLKKETFNELKKTNPEMAGEFYRRHREVLGQEPLVKLTEKRIRERMQREMKQFNRRFNTVHRNKVKRRIIER